MMEETRAANADLQQATPIDLTNTCMLVSDSNEVSNQLDSKQLVYGTLVDLAEDNLFKKYLDMSRYLTKNQYGIYKGMLEDRFNALNDLTNALPNPKTHPIKLRVANGQVILLEARSIPPKKSPLQLIYDNWDITSEYQVLPIPDCMLRGMLELAESAELGAGINLVADKQGNEEVTLKSENVPPHMHHSSVTTGQGFTTMTRDPSNNSYYIKGNTTYDMFYNDSLDVGLSKNELDGTIDGFSVDGQGRNDGGDVGNPVMSHDNMPKYQAFYGFVVKKIT